MALEILPVLSFALVTSLTPGPNNVSSASMGILYGYGRTLPYLAGIAFGFLLVQVLCILMSSLLLETLPVLEPVLRLVGALYVLWLAYGTIRTSYAFDPEDHPPLGFRHGAALQLVNPKGLVYGMALYSTFLAALAGQYMSLLPFAFLFSCLGFCTVSVWALGGAAIRAHLHHRKVRNAVNLCLSLLLVYTAVELSGLLSFF
ncbi:LysE family translocator [Salidesulfovibrio onnuriiensis]|uniref:LysE family translocator n=1 Tax=Salidesulfovibrio onnuriiensis TaxID=2583823 RepID=UPI0011C754D3|nr:LysE family transporter [Salidesulfovibrio onnuriiensis]